MTANTNVGFPRRIGTGVVLALFVLLASVGFAQQLTGTLTGIASDSAGAVIPGAKVTLINEASGDPRTTLTNGSGYFSITAIPSGSYTVQVSAPGFKTWEEKNIPFSQGASHSLTNITLEVGGAKETMEITAGALVVPVDNAEVSTTLNATAITDTPILGRDAGELLKLMPGMALNNGGSQGSSFSDKVVGTNTGPVGSYSANGTQPNGAMAFMLDGANLVDPGNMGTQIANINQDMVSEVKVLMSSYSAEYAKGPVIFQAISKSGGNQFHGEGYLYARNSALNSWEAYNRQQYRNDLASGASAALVAQQLHPDEHYYYMGGNIGGPIAFGPVNRSHKKLFFWAGYEYMNQHPAAQALNMNVPTLAQRGGDFSNADLTAAQLKGINDAGFGYAYNNVPAIDPSLFDVNLTGGNPDGNHGILGLYPKPNISPNQGNGFNNYQYVNKSPQNRWELTGKVDYAFSDNTKLSVSYTRQIENDQHPIAIWWAPAWTLPYPSPIVAPTTSQVFLSNFTHVFSSTTTNEFVFSLARYINPSSLSNPSAVDRTKLGFNVQGLFGHTTKQMPNFYGPWGGAFPDFRQPSFDGGYMGNAFGGTKKDPALFDNFTKVIGRHTIKTGFYWDTSENIQSNSGQDNGIYNLGWGATGTGNVVADFLLGKSNNYQQASAVPVQDIKFHQWAIYGQDAFKATRRLTVNYGLRLDHVGQWYGPSAGAQVWNPATYTNDPSVQNPGLLWHAIDKSIPQSGFVSPTFYYEPRVGAAYDVFGNGKTVVRGGMAVFRYQVSTEVGGAFNGPLGAFTFQTPATTTGFDQINSGGAFTPPSGVFQNGANISALQRGDNRTPKVVDWNITLSQALPWHSVFEVSYVGNKSTNQWINGSNDKVNDANSVLPGSYFKPDPTIAGPNNLVSPNGLVCSATGTAAKDPIDCNSPSLRANYANGFAVNHFRPLTNYQDIYVLTHGAYANYNSLQVSLQKQSGRATFLANYTFSKVLGIRDGSSDNGAGNGKAVDAFNLRANYAPLAYDHTHIFNISGVWNLGNPIRSKGSCEDVSHCSSLLAGLVNGWRLSTYTTYQSGAPLQPSTGGNLNAIYNSTALTVPLNGATDLPDNSILLPNGLKSLNVNPGTWFGTDQNGGGSTVLLPTLTCDPRKHASGFYFNPNCFGVPAYGQQGVKVWPYLRNPAYFDSDLGLYKDFKVTERQKVEFRVSAVNWLNHPLPQFGLAGNSDQQLNFTNTTFKPENDATECGLVGYQWDGSTLPCNARIISVAGKNTNTDPVSGTTGKPHFKTGSRFLTFSVKYFF